jgi:hypothetical protein
MVPYKVLKSHWLVEPDTPTLFRGQSFMEVGYVYAPYIPIQRPTQSSGTIQPKRSISTRYATTVVNNSYYGVVDII